MAVQSYAVFPDLLKEMIGCPWIGAAGWLGVGAALGIAVTVVVTGLKCWRFVDRRLAIASNAMQRMHLSEESDDEDVLY
ncbi:hypothetical protein Y032_0009g809 [Ancylostoma ceylanicum]|uniref:Uncharacterized protein n=1 Tax=Ancylostoma ceylanicum TaxID=53326 RepID=A0A016VLG9_9BILA|nr:hypothetical protein Y032_0009g809 [Ancylostoma ceylanicum]